LRQVERQVERLGFGEEYIVSSSQGPNANRAKVRLYPTSGCQGESGSESGSNSNRLCHQPDATLLAPSPLRRFGRGEHSVV
jgi:hypothetical protein